jgi:hypothetical protein
MPILWELSLVRNWGAVYALSAPFALISRGRYSRDREVESRLPGAILLWRIAEEGGV